MSAQPPTSTGPASSHGGGSAFRGVGHAFQTWQVPLPDSIMVTTVVAIAVALAYVLFIQSR